jgi:hypothetical protein
MYTTKRMVQFSADGCHGNSLDRAGGRAFDAGLNLRVPQPFTFL